jgi:hypothetical protein
MALRLVQLKLPDAEYDSITEIIADQKFVTTWPDHRVSGQLITKSYKGFLQKWTLMMDSYSRTL